MNSTPPWANLLLAVTMGLALVGASTASPTVRVVLQSEQDRKPAPNFILRDASGKVSKLEDYRGKVVLLDFWATWCHGCKEEIPWFSQLEKTYNANGLVVVGVSLDEKGWPVVKPFLASAKVSYCVVLGDHLTAQEYEIKALPDAYLIDRQGRIAAAYANGLVDKDNLETNIRMTLRE
jgi:peroxiredoxin